ncbi:hypothetical protein ID866_1748 [Astraeus odoratus]|nr:hypothetical protein ID866_1748 [Astraeus odoratus]
MATTSVPSRATPSPSRKSSHSLSPPSAAVMRSASSARAALATARATTPSLNSGVSRRGSVKNSSGSLGSVHDSREVLSASLKQETEKKEQLLLQLQNKDQTITNLTSENDNLMSSLNAAESRLSDLYADQARMEEELATRFEVIDKLRAQARELEKEKRDLQRRYNEQTSTFEAERQAFYDNEQHLKSRIQSLTQSRKQLEPPQTAGIEPEVIPEETFPPKEPSTTIPAPRQDMNDPESEPAEMTALRLELSTLSTSYSSLQSTLQLLQSQLVDLKRVNNQLQEENESYMILLREKTLSGQFDLMRQVGTLSTASGLDDDDMMGEGDTDSFCSTGRSTLDRVEEIAEEGEEDVPFTADLQSVDSRRRHPTRHSRKASPVSHSPTRGARGESLADLPVAGPGLDLAAELGRAENKDMDVGTSLDERHGLSKGRRRKGSVEQRKVSSSETHDPVASTNDIDALRSEVKSLKDANKALSLYASKIIDRIIAEEGFEHVLAVDYEKGTKTPATTSGVPKTLPATNITSTPVKTSKPRPQSTIFGRAASNPLTTGPPESTPALTSSITTDTSPAAPSATTKTQRRSLSFDWRGFSMFGGGDKKFDNPALRPLTLKGGTTAVTGARKLETYEDEEDRRERERLRATMKLLGIEQPDPPPESTLGAMGSPAAVPMQKSYSSPASPPPTATPLSRFSIFRSRSMTGSDASSANQSATSHGVSDVGMAELTQEALEQAEAENTLTVLDAQERVLGEEIAKGGSGGFTEISSRNLGEEWRSRRSRRSGGGSSSTVWSAGMSRAGDDPEP